MGEFLFFLAIFSSILVKKDLKMQISAFELGANQTDTLSIRQGLSLIPPRTYIQSGV